MKSHTASAASIEYSPSRLEIICKGHWTLDSISHIEKQLDNLIGKFEAGITIKGESIEKVDSAGALLIFQFIHDMADAGKPIKSYQLTPECQSLLELLKKQEKTVLPAFSSSPPNWLYDIGKWTYFKIIEMIQFLAFIGEFAITLLNIIRRPSHIAWRSIAATIDEMGYNALPIVALLTFAVGVVVTYQIAIQLANYGADIYIVDLTGMIIFREFGPLITAIIAAGRTSTAFTAQLGTMKVNEEIDALATLGIPPYERLVVPKFLGLLIALPLLTVWANLFGIMGAMVTAKIKLAISYYSFMERFQYQIEVRHYLIGLVKVPIFATIIALIGCFEGFQVAQGADSVGEKTTKSAVQSIFLIIIADAIISVALNMQGL